MAKAVTYLAPLPRITSIKRNFKWMKVEQNNFDEIKRIVAHNNVLTYIYFNDTFKIIPTLARSN